MLELKRGHGGFRGDASKTPNRTMLELKLERDLVTQIEERAPNRTMLELKLLI